MVIIEVNENKFIIKREMVSLTPPAYNHMMSTFVHSHFLSFFFVFICNRHRQAASLFFLFFLFLMKGHWRSMWCPHECVCICVDYVITLLLSLSFHYIRCVCVCLSSCPSCMCVNVGRVDQYEKKKPRRKKKFRSSATA